MSKRPEMSYYILNKTFYCFLVLFLVKEIMYIWSIALNFFTSCFPQHTSCNRFFINQTDTFAIVSINAHSSGSITFEVTYLLNEDHTLQPLDFCGKKPRSLPRVFWPKERTPSFTRFFWTNRTFDTFSLKWFGTTKRFIAKFYFGLLW